MLPVQASGSDLTYLVGGAPAPTCRDFPRDDNLEITHLGDSPVCLQKYHSRSSSSFTLCSQSVLQRGTLRLLCDLKL